MKKNTKTKITIALTIWFLTAFATTVWASGQITEHEFKARKALKGEIGLNYTAPRLKEQNLSIKQHVWELLTEEGGLSFDQAIEGMAIVSCESSWNVYAIGVNKDGSKDLGLWQLSEKWHGKNINRAGSFDVYASTRYAIKLFRDWGNSWDAWVCAK